VIDVPFLGCSMWNVVHSVPRGTLVDIYVSMIVYLQ
jgi:hypothetical protein